MTTLAFSQPDVDHDDALSVGPGWEFYLDRLVAARPAASPETADFERDYYPAMAEYYREQRDNLIARVDSLRLRAHEVARPADESGQE